MNHRYVSIAAASLAALTVGIAPAVAQISRGLDTGGSTSTSGSTNTNVNSSGSATGGASGSATGGASGSATGGTSGSVDTNTQSPSASPSMGHDQAPPDDRDKMKQQEQIDKKTGLDRADEAAGPHGAQGRDNARTRGNRR